MTWHELLLVTLRLKLVLSVGVKWHDDDDEFDDTA